MRKFLLLATLAGIALVGWAPAAVAQYVGNITEVRGVDVSRPPAAQPEAVVRASESEVTESEDELPITGGDIVGLTVMGAGAIAVGSALQVRRRRRPAV